MIAIAMIDQMFTNWQVDEKRIEKGVTHAHRALVIPSNQTMERGLSSKAAESHRGSLADHNKVECGFSVVNVKVTRQILVSFVQMMEDLCVVYNVAIKVSVIRIIGAWR